GDTIIRVWDAKSGKSLLTIHSKVFSVGGLAYSPDGKVIAATSQDGLVGLWDADTGKEFRRFYFYHDDEEKRAFWNVRTTHLAFRPDGRRLAVPGQNVRKAGHPGEVGIFRTETGERLLTLNGHAFTVFSVVFSPDGRFLASGSSDDTCRIWDASTGKLLHTLRGHDDSVYQVLFSPSGKWLATADLGGVVMLWDPSTGKAIRTLKAHEGSVRSLATNARGTILATGSSDGTVRVWDVRTGRVRAKYQGAQDTWFNALAIAPDGQTILAVQGKDIVRLPFTDGDK
ncbi:MAG TPA: WD40 repeat domain-containing protein, partial [Spirochaetia bacterium]|nr:WD40 repeat domain-containing protein [Spirochaetia bacterium]